MSCRGAICQNIFLRACHSKLYNSHITTNEGTHRNPGASLFQHRSAGWFLSSVLDGSLEVSGRGTPESFSLEPHLAMALCNVCVCVCNLELSNFLEISNCFVTWCFLQPWSNWPSRLEWVSLSCASWKAGIPSTVDRCFVIFYQEIPVCC